MSVYMGPDPEILETLDLDFFDSAVEEAANYDERTALVMNKAQSWLRWTTYSVWYVAGKGPVTASCPRLMQVHRSAISACDEALHEMSQREEELGGGRLNLRGLSEEAPRPHVRECRRCGSCTVGNDEDLLAHRRSGPHRPVRDRRARGLNRDIGVRPGCKGRPTPRTQIAPLHSR